MSASVWFHSFDHHKTGKGATTPQAGSGPGLTARRVAGRAPLPSTFSTLTERTNASSPSAGNDVARGASANTRPSLGVRSVSVPYSEART